MDEPSDKISGGGVIVRVRAFMSRFNVRYILPMLGIGGSVVGVLFWLIYSSSAPTQPTTVTLNSRDDLRVIYANAEEVAEGKRLAEASCASCHGANGISATPGIPHLAGQRPVYLYLELRVYRSGGRGDSPMTNAVKFLSDDTMFKMAAYYASLDPAQPDAANAGKAPPAEVDPVQTGKAAAAGCPGCHGEAGISKTPGMPSLAGLDPKYLSGAMKAYKDGQRKNAVMVPLLGAVGEADINNLALYYALQTPGRAQTSAPGNPTAGKAAAAACAACHGEDGVSGNPSYPSLAGQDAQYLASALQAYKDGSRNDATMQGLAAALDSDTMQNLAAFYAMQQPQPANVRKPLTAAEWAQRCDRCHGINGNSTDPHSPALAAQRLDYLDKVLHAYRTGARSSPAMAAMSAVLSEQDVENLAAYYAHQQARAFVYLIVPAK